MSEYLRYSTDHQRVERKTSPRCNSLKTEPSAAGRQCGFHAAVSENMRRYTGMGRTTQFQEDKGPEYVS